MSESEQCCDDHDNALSARYQVVSCQQLPALLDGDALLLDCRKLGDYRGGHIEGALHVHDGLVASLIDSGDRSRPVVIYCYHGHNSEHLAEAFANAGFSQVFSVAGGYAAWSAGQRALH